MSSQKIVAGLSALAHEHRLAAYRLLVQAGPAGMPAGHVAEQLGIPPSSLTFHLQHLFRADLITQRRASRQLIYAANFAAMNVLVSYLTDNCCGGNFDPLCAVAVCKPPGKIRNGRSVGARKSV
jgi:ArsR family transcriptional regulator, arsenate/arsenite/antimonite-responsive transcriptional repressor